MKIRDCVASAWADASPQTGRWLALLLQREGTDLSEATGAELARGTPVYVHGDAEVIDVQRLMARNHIRRVPVVDGEELVGLVDLVELALGDHADAG